MALPDILKSTIDKARSDGTKLMWIADFDGTLSPYVDFHDEAEPASGVATGIAALRGSGVEVIVISGRPVAYLQTQLGKQGHLIGCYGAESLKDGEFSLSTNTGNWPAVISMVNKLALEAFEKFEVPFGTKAREAHEDHAIYVERKPISTHIYPCVPPDVVLGARALEALNSLNIEEYGLELDVQPDVLMLRPENFWNLFSKEKALAELLNDKVTPIFCGDDPTDIGCAQLTKKFGGVTIVVDNAKDSLRPGTPTGLLADADVVLTGNTFTAQEQLGHLMMATAEHLS